MKRFDVYLIALDPTVGSAIRKTRPAERYITGYNEFKSFKNSNHSAFNQYDS
jgi:hypothetical protein